MKVVTVRQIPRELARAIERRASSVRTSVDKAVIGLLEEAVGLARKFGTRACHHDLDALAGSWSGEETAPFKRSLQAPAWDRSGRMEVRRIILHTSA